MTSTRYSRARGGIVLLAVMGLLVSAPPAPAKVTGPNLAFDPATFNFGTSPKAFTLTNSGDTATGTIVISRSGASNYTLGSDGCTGRSLGPGKHCSVSVSFTPPASCGIVTATLTATAPKRSASAALTGGAACPAPVTITSFNASVPSCAFDVVYLAASATGGTGSYFFTFKDGDTTLGTIPFGEFVDRSPVPDAIYSVAATDGAGSTSAPTTASATFAPPFDVRITETPGVGSVDLSANASGGIPPYQAFLWSNGATTETVTVSATGTYSVNVIDSFGCSEVDAFTVTSIPSQ